MGNDFVETQMKPTAFSETTTTLPVDVKPFCGSTDSENGKSAYMDMDSCLLRKGQLLFVPSDESPSGSSGLLAFRIAEYLGQGRYILEQMTNSSSGSTGHSPKEVEP